MKIEGNTTIIYIDDSSPEAIKILNDDEYEIKNGQLIFK